MFPFQADVSSGLSRPRVSQVTQSDLVTECRHPGVVQNLLTDNKGVGCPVDSDLAKIIVPNVAANAMPNGLIRTSPSTPVQAARG